MHQMFKGILLSVNVCIIIMCTHFLYLPDLANVRGKYIFTIIYSSNYIITCCIYFGEFLRLCAHCGKEMMQNI